MASSTYLVYSNTYWHSYICTCIKQPWTISVCFCVANVLKKQTNKQPTTSTATRRSQKQETSFSSWDFLKNFHQYLTWISNFFYAVRRWTDGFWVGWSVGRLFGCAIQSMTTGCFSVLLFARNLICWLADWLPQRCINQIVPRTCKSCFRL